MKTQTRTNKTPKVLELPKSYRGLCEQYLPRPIHDGGDYEAAQEAVRPLVGFESELTADQVDYLDAISTFIEQYEQENVKWPETKPEDALRFLVKEHGMSGADLARLLEVDPSLGTKILRGERRLTVEHIRILSKHFAVNPDLFIG